MTKITVDPIYNRYIDFCEDLYFPDFVNPREIVKDIEEKLKFGDMVRVYNQRERFWVIVRAFIEDDGAKFMVGEIYNFLLMTNEYNCSDLIVFNYENIYEKR